MAKGGVGRRKHDERSRGLIRQAECSDLIGQERMPFNVHTCKERRFLASTRKVVERTQFALSCWKLILRGRGWRWPLHYSDTLQDVEFCGFQHRVCVITVKWNMCKVEFKFAPHAWMNPMQWRGAVEHLSDKRINTVFRCFSNGDHQKRDWTFEESWIANLWCHLIDNEKGNRRFQHFQHFQLTAKKICSRREVRQ